MPEKKEPETEAKAEETKPAPEPAKPSKAELRAALIRQKINAGLTKEQAETVVAGQEAWDASPDHPANKKAK